MRAPIRMFINEASYEANAVPRDDRDNNCYDDEERVHSAYSREKTPRKIRACRTMSGCLPSLQQFLLVEPPGNNCTAIFNEQPRCRLLYAHRMYDFMCRK